MLLGTICPIIGKEPRAGSSNCSVWLPGLVNVDNILLTI